MITIKSKSEIELMREVCKLTGLMYKELEKHIKPGISTYELDKIAENFMRAHGALPAQKGYNPGIKGVPPFPCSICTSINDEVIHGIPSKRAILKEGDVLKNKEYSSVFRAGEVVKFNGKEVTIGTSLNKEAVFNYINKLIELCGEDKEIFKDMTSSGTV